MNNKQRHSLYFEEKVECFANNIFTVYLFITYLFFYGNSNELDKSIILKESLNNTRMKFDVKKVQT